MLFPTCDLSNRDGTATRLPNFVGPQIKSPTLTRRALKNGGPDEDPTCDLHSRDGTATRLPGVQVFTCFPLNKKPTLSSGYILFKWWTRQGSNLRPPACHAGALPAELRARLYI